MTNLRSQSGIIKRLDWENIDIWVNQSYISSDALLLLQSKIHSWLEDSDYTDENLEEEDKEVMELVPT